MSRPDMRAGDIVFCHSPRFVSRFIRLVDRGWASHVAIAVSETEIVEATARGVVRREIGFWPDDVEIRVFSPEMDAEDREDAVRQAERLAGAGWSYGWVQFFAMPVFWATGGRIFIGSVSSAFCSALVADCLHSGNEYFSECSPFVMTPRMLERHYGLPHRGAGG